MDTGSGELQRVSPQKCKSIQCGSSATTYFARHSDVDYLDLDGLHFLSQITRFLFLSF